MIDQQVAADAGQPCAEGAFRGAAGLQRAEPPQEDFLRQALRLRTASREAIAQAVDSAGVEPDEILPGGLLSAHASRYEARIRVQGIFYQIAASANSVQGGDGTPAGRPIYEISKSYRRGCHGTRSFIWRNEAFS